MEIKHLHKRTFVLGQTVEIPFYSIDPHGYGVLMALDPSDSLRFRVLDSSLNEVVPWTSLDPETDYHECFYLATVTTGTGAMIETAGKYFLEFESQGNVTTRFRRSFEVLEGPVEFENEIFLCLVHDVKEQLSSSSTYTDNDIATAIVRATTFVHRYTGRIFVPRLVNERCVFSPGRMRLEVPEPLIAACTVGGSSLPSDGSFLANRAHLNALWGAPSFGDDPRDHGFVRLPFVPYTLVDGTTEVVGLFGYTEPDGSPEGRTPEQIRLATIHLALKYLANLLGSEGSSGGGTSIIDRIIEEKTATQMYKLQPLSDETLTSMVGGDTELERLLKPFRRPPQIGIV